jgi:hypothetical protein
MKYILVLLLTAMRLTLPSNAAELTGYVKSEDGKPLSVGINIALSSRKTTAGCETFFSANVDVWWKMGA